MYSTTKYGKSIRNKLNGIYNNHINNINEISDEHLKHRNVYSRRDLSLQELINNKKEMIGGCANCNNTCSETKYKKQYPKLKGGNKYNMEYE